MTPVPEEVALFIYTHFHSVVQLEALRVLESDPDAEWSAGDVAAKVQTTPAAIAAHLDELSARGLIDPTRRGHDSRWRAGPRTRELEVLVRRLLQLYLERPVTVIRMVYAADAARQTNSHALSDSSAV